MDSSPGRRRMSMGARRAAAVPHSNVFRVPSNISVTLGLQWNFIGEEPIDLDASCVAFDRDCNAVDVVFFNHLESDGAQYMVHSGDNRTGEDDGTDDETITFHMAKIPDHVFYMMVCVTSYGGADFRLVESANVRVINNVDGKIVGTFSLSVVGQHTGSLLCVFSRYIPEGMSDVTDGGAATQYWDLREINKPCFGYSFCDILPEMLRLLGVEDADGIRERVQLLPDYSLEKNYNVDDMTLSQLRLGLGWDGENDLDASVVMVGDDGQYIDHVHAKYGKLRSRDGAVTHGGDKLNGYAVLGDDEFIDVNLMIVDPRVKAIYFIALLYDGMADSLPEVPKCYVRMQNKSSPNDHAYVEVARIDINSVSEPVTALVAFAAVRQSMASWLQPLCHVGQGMQGRDWVDVFPFLRTYHRVNPRVFRSPVDWTWAWEKWSADVFPFGLRVTFGGVRNLSPQEPHFFRAHCLAWVQDKRNSPRFRSKLTTNRDNIAFDESALFVVNKMDVLRVMVYEIAMVGWVDIPMCAFFGQSGQWPEAETGIRSYADVPALKIAVSDVNGKNGAGSPTGAPFSPTSTTQPLSASGDEEMALIPHRQHTEKPQPSILSSPSAHAASLDGDDGGKRATLPAEGHVLVDAWFPLEGHDVSGDIHLRLERVPLPEAPRQSSSFCVVM